MLNITQYIIISNIKDKMKKYIMLIFQNLIAIISFKTLNCLLINNVVAVIKSDTKLYKIFSY